MKYKCPHCKKTLYQSDANHEGEIIDSGLYLLYPVMKNYLVSLKINESMEIEAEDENEAREVFWQWLSEQIDRNTDTMIEVEKL